MTLELLIRELAAQGTREALGRHLPELLSRFTAPPDPDLLRRYEAQQDALGRPDYTGEVCPECRDPWCAGCEYADVERD